MSLISPMDHIVVMGSDNIIYERQPFPAFPNNPSPHIQAVAYGTTFLDLLTQEGLLTEKLKLNRVLTGNAHADATRLCGNLAEALVVKYCHKYLEVNRTLAAYAARFGESEILDDFIAVGTASKLTKIDYPQHYQPNDTQRDIIWVDKFDNTKQLTCIGSTALSSQHAGLQVKASHNGYNYIIPNIRDYYYPILYFDISNDWHIVQSEIRRRGIQATLIHPDEITQELKSHLIYYYNTIVSLINNETTIEKIISQAKYNEDSILIAGLSASELQSGSTIILHA